MYLQHIFLITEGAWDEFNTIWDEFVLNSVQYIFNTIHCKDIVY